MASAHLEGRDPATVRALGADVLGRLAATLLSGSVGSRKAVGTFSSARLRGIGRGRYCLSGGRAGELPSCSTPTGKFVRRVGPPRTRIARSENCTVAPSLSAAAI